MSSEQTTSESTGASALPHSTRRGAILFLSAAAALGGCALFLMPFVSSSESWQWRLDDRDALVGARVNANLLSIDDRGIRLARKGSRHISLITPPLELPSGAGRVVSIEAALPDLAATDAVSTQVKLLWQTEDVPEFKHETITVDLSADPRPIRFSLPRAAPEIHRLGIQFPGLSGPVQIRSIGLPALSASSRVVLALQQAARREPIENHSINFLTGPVILGKGLNYYLVSGAAAGLGVYLLVTLLRRGRIRGRVMVGVILAAWMVADAQFTWSLWSQASEDAMTFGGRSDADRIALAYGRELTWAEAQLKAHCGEGESFAVVSDDPFGPAHRLGYLLAPQRIRKDSYAAASFIAVIHGQSAVYDETERRFRVGTGDWVDADRVSSLESRVYLMRRQTP